LQDDLIAMGGFLAQILNGLQYGLLLFLISSGLTLIFGVMGVINLAHGSLFMIGAYLAYVVTETTGEFWLALPAAIIGGLVFGAVLERLLFQRFRQREHLDQVLLTFALILLFEEARASLIDNQFHAVPVPKLLDFSVPVIAGFSWSAYRIAVLAICLLVAATMVGFVERTRLGASIRAAAENPEMVDLLGIDARLIHTVVFAIGTALVMLAGTLAAPLQSVYPGMGDGFLILSFIVVVIGGLGSIAGAFWAAILVGLIDTLGKVYVPSMAGISVCGMMALVLLWRPTGLFSRA
jgi:branched-chain amino acid transport system permease protein